jgi:hypothetical protein
MDRSEAIKRGLRRAKERGVVLSSPQAIAAAATANQFAANTRAEALRPEVEALMKQGVISYSGLARALNDRRVPPARGGKRWYPMTTKLLLRRLGIVELPGDEKVDA